MVTKIGDSVTFILKVYLHLKLITSQNVPSKGQTKNFFVLQKSSDPFFRYSIFCIYYHHINFQIYDVMTSITIWESTFFEPSEAANLAGQQFENFGQKFWLTTRYNQVQYFSENF